ncbi:uncharacterized protein VP01_596g10 [Puccinia sorghi]|uniref:Uncharacterized protein n=1 Tax=Puccinia sorghi TaxID=27349 RepID=A0A0L6UJP4_9BASI|nr:uncharacterized protein VP01_596g10 [Puccinia sorghi]
MNIQETPTQPSFLRVVADQKNQGLASGDPVSRSFSLTAGICPVFGTLSVAQMSEAPSYSAGLACAVFTQLFFPLSIDFQFRIFYRLSDQPPTPTEVELKPFVQMSHSATPAPEVNVQTKFLSEPSKYNIPHSCLKSELSSIVDKHTTETKAFDAIRTNFQGSMRFRQVNPLEHLVNLKTAPPPTDVQSLQILFNTIFELLSDLWKVGPC